MSFSRLDLDALTPEYQGLIVAGLFIAVALALAWGAGRLIGTWLDRWVATQAPNLAGGFVGRIGSLTRYFTAALLLAAFSELSSAVGASGRILIVGALGIAAALLIYQIARSFRLGTTLAAFLALVVGVGLIAGRLGGLDPLTIGLDRAAISFGKTRLSLLDILNFVLIAALLFGAVRVAVRSVNRSIGNIQALDLSQRVLVQKFASIAVVAIAFFVGIDVLGIDLTALAVFSGAFGLAVGFGFQKTFGNLISGLILLMDRSIKPGDVIVVADTFGWVNKIGVRYVSVLTRDGKEHLIPNETLMTEPVENWSYTNKNVRLHVKIGVPHDCDVHLAQRLMLEATHGIARILDDPAPVCWITAITLNAIEHEIRIWIDDPEQGVTNVQGEVLLRIWQLFREHGIPLPREQQDVHVQSLPAASAEPPALRST
ncbi:MAG: mechanosensitive ion channel [Sphingomonadaceae bacterium]|nr:mechanosensitive ion channel [Sphingomonadaceae bacterium]